MINKKFLIIGGVVILVCLIVGGLLLRKQIPIPSPLPPTLPTKPKKELKLSDFPEAFKDRNLIVVGDNASDIEMQAVNEIADYLQKKTENKPLVKKYSEITDKDKRNHNLIIVGTPKTNPLLEEVYALTNATRVTEEFPGEGKGVLEILRNPWDEEKAMLLVEGGDEKEVVLACREVYFILASKIKIGIKEGVKTYEGIVSLPFTKVSPQLDECFSSSPYIQTKDGKIYWLENICPFIFLLPNETLINTKVIITDDPVLFKKEVKGEGELKEKIWKGQILNVIVISNLGVVN